MDFAVLSLRPCAAAIMVRTTKRLGDEGVVRGGEDDGAPRIRDGWKGAADVVHIDPRLQQLF